MRLGWGIAFVLLVGCRGAHDVDGGLDADITFDAGPPRTDAAADARADAMTLPEPVVMAATNVEMEVAAFETTRDSIPSAVEMTIDVLELDLCIVGIDFLIGENGIQTLSLSDATVRALADIEQSGRLITRLNAAIALLPVGAAPEVTATHDAAVRVRDSLVAYRTALLPLFRARLADGIVGTPVPTVHDEELFAQWTNHEMVLLSVIERDATSGLATMEAVCPAAVPVTTYRVFDEENGALITTGQTTGTTGTAVINVDIAPSSTRVLRIVLDPIIRTSTSGSTCVFTITSKRNLRASPQRYTSADFDLAYNWSLGTFIAAQNTIENTRALGADGYALDSVERVMTLYYAVLSPIFAMASTQLTVEAAVEDLERALRLFAYVDPIMDALLASSELSGAVFLNVRNDVGAMQVNAQSMVTALRALL